MRNIFILFLFVFSGVTFSQVSENSKAKDGNILPVRGFCIAAPQSKDLEAFIKFIDEELAPRSSESPYSEGGL